MKGGNYNRFRGRHLSVTLITLAFTTIILWVSEKNPSITTLLTGQDQFTWLSSGSCSESINIIYMQIFAHLLSVLLPTIIKCTEKT